MGCRCRDNCENFQIPPGFPHAIIEKCWLFKENIFLNIINCVIFVSSWVSLGTKYLHHGRHQHNHKRHPHAIIEKY